MSICSLSAAASSASTLTRMRAKVVEILLEVSERFPRPPLWTGNLTGVLRGWRQRAGGIRVSHDEPLQHQPRALVPPAVPVHPEADGQGRLPHPGAGTLASLKHVSLLTQHPAYVLHGPASVVCSIVVPRAAWGLTAAVPDIRGRRAVPHRSVYRSGGGQSFGRSQDQAPQGAHHAPEAADDAGGARACRHLCFWRGPPGIRNHLAPPPKRFNAAFHHGGLRGGLSLRMQVDMRCVLRGRISRGGEGSLGHVLLRLLRRGRKHRAKQPRPHPHGGCCFCFARCAPPRRRRSMRLLFFSFVVDCSGGGKHVCLVPARHYRGRGGVGTTSHDVDFSAPASWSLAPAAALPSNTRLPLVLRCRRRVCGAPSTWASSRSWPRSPSHSRRRKIGGREVLLHYLQRLFHPRCHVRGVHVVALTHARRECRANLSLPRRAHSLLLVALSPILPALLVHPGHVAANVERLRGDGHDAGVETLPQARRVGVRFSLRVELLDVPQRFDHLEPVPHLVRKPSDDRQPPHHVEGVLLIVHPLHGAGVVEALQQDGHEQVAQQADAEDDEGEEVKDGGPPVGAPIRVRASYGVRRLGGAGPVHVLESVRPVTRQHHEQKRRRTAPVRKVRVARESDAVVGAGDGAVQGAAQTGVDVHQQGHQHHDVEHAGQRGLEGVDERAQAARGLEHLEEAEEARSAEHGDEAARAADEVRRQFQDAQDGDHEVHFVPAAVPVRCPFHGRDVDRRLQHVQAGEDDAEDAHCSHLLFGRPVPHQAHLQGVAGDEKHDEHIPPFPLAQFQTQPPNVAHVPHRDIAPRLLGLLETNVERLEPLALRLTVVIPLAACRPGRPLEFARHVAEVVHQSRHEQVGPEEIRKDNHSDKVKRTQRRVSLQRLLVHAGGVRALPHQVLPVVARGHDEHRHGGLADVIEVKGSVLPLPTGGEAPGLGPREITHITKAARPEHATKEVHPEHACDDHDDQAQGAHRQHAGEGHQGGVDDELETRDGFYHPQGP
mmetsp:Transcript_37973/g.94377  ORF Transcript_37973/g.94377 Transcript_37973/m.94377 type:complete len:1000 (-) Transcript_37973:1105-4104(-)